MIIEPDFVDHWKTRLLVTLLGDDELAPVYLIRLWAHCQQRKSHSFDSLPTAALKAICRFPGNADDFERALVESKFVGRDDEVLTVLGWDEYNAALIANWTNGAKGGRPKKQTQPEPSDNPTETLGLSHDGNGVSDREEKIGVDGNGEELKSKAKAAPKARKTPKTTIPTDFALSDSVIAWAEKKGHKNLQAHFDSFVLKAQAKGYTYVNWDLALQNAIADNWAKLGVESRAGPPPKFDPTAAVNRNRIPS